MQTFASSSRLFAVTLSPEALITSLSSGVANLLGYAPQELLHRPITRILADDSAFEVPQMLNAAEKWGHWEGGIIFRSRDGNTVEGWGTLVILAGDQNRPGGRLLFSNLEKTSASDATRTPALMEVSIRLRAIAHDLNNPLAVVTGFTQLLSLNESCPAAVHEDIEKVYSELMRVIELVEEMHAYAISLGAKSSQGESRVEAAGSVISGQSGGSASTAGSPSEY